MRTITGRGEHWYYRAPATPITKRNDALRGNPPGIDLIAEGGYVVAPGSIHSASRQPYSAVSPWEALDVASIPVFDPAWLPRIPDALPRKPQEVPQRTARLARGGTGGTRLDARERARLYLAKVDPAMSGQRGHDRTYDAALILVKGFDLDMDTAFDLLQQEYNPRCKPPWTEAELRHKVQDAARSDRVPAGFLRNVERPRPDVERPRPDVERPRPDVERPRPDQQEERTEAAAPTMPVLAPLPPRAAVDGGEEWRAELLKDQQGNLKKEVGNIITILSQHPTWKGVLRWNEFTWTIELQKPPPFDRPRLNEWTDDDATRVRQWLARNMEFIVGRELVMDAVPVAAQKHSYHPIMDYLLSIIWDGRPRVSNWIHVYMGAELSDYSKLIGQFFLISAVARVMEPGCQVDNMIILEGKQGIGKSRALRALASPQFFSDTSFEIGSKDSYLYVQGRWIIEISEIYSLIRATDAAAKGFITSRSDRFRPPYGRTMQTFLRSNVFAGTTNERQYLKDSTGNRRYWPIECGKIELAAIERDRDQIWAEAVFLYRENRPWWPENDSELKMLEMIRNERVQQHPWRDPIESWINSADGSDRIVIDKNEITTELIMERVIKLPIAGQNQKSQNDICSIMRDLGFQIKQKRIKGIVRRCFVPI